MECGDFVTAFAAGGAGEPCLEAAREEHEKRERRTKVLLRDLPRSIVEDRQSCLSASGAEWDSSGRGPRVVGWDRLLFDRLAHDRPRWNGDELPLYGVDRPCPLHLKRPVTMTTDNSDRIVAEVRRADVDLGVTPYIFSGVPRASARVVRLSVRNAQPRSGRSLARTTKVYPGHVLARLTVTNDHHHHRQLRFAAGSAGSSTTTSK
jgi:hypothetical protein